MRIAATRRSIAIFSLPPAQNVSRPNYLPSAVTVLKNLPKNGSLCLDIGECLTYNRHIRHDGGWISQMALRGAHSRTSDDLKGLFPILISAASVSATQPRSPSPGVPFA